MSLTLLKPAISVSSLVSLTRLLNTTNPWTAIWKCINWLLLIVSKFGHTYLLTVICQATSYPTAYPLYIITAKAVVRALTQFTSIFSIPKVMQSDQGSNLTSHLFSQVLIRLHIKHNKSTADHAQNRVPLNGSTKHLNPCCAPIVQSCWMTGRMGCPGYCWPLVKLSRRAQVSARMT